MQENSPSPPSRRKNLPKASSWSDGRKEKPLKAWQPFSRFSLRGRVGDDLIVQSRNNLNHDGGNSSPESSDGEAQTDSKSSRKSLNINIKGVDNNNNNNNNNHGGGGGKGLLSPRAITRKVARDKDYKKGSDSPSPSAVEQPLPNGVKKRRRRSLVQALKSGLFGNFEGDEGDGGGGEKETKDSAADEGDGDEAGGGDDENNLSDRRRAYAMTRNIGYTNIRKLGMQKRVGIVGEEEIIGDDATRKLLQRHNNPSSPTPPRTSSSATNPGEEDQGDENKPDNDASSTAPPSVPPTRIESVQPRSPPRARRAASNNKRAQKRRSIVLILRSPLKSNDEPSSMDAIDEFAREREEIKNSPRFGFEGFKRGSTGIDPAHLFITPQSPLQPRPQQQQSTSPRQGDPGEKEGSEESTGEEWKPSTAVTRKKRRSLVLMLKNNILPHAHSEDNNRINNYNHYRSTSSEEGQGGMRWVITHAGVKEVYDDPKEEEEEDICSYDDKPAKSPAAKTPRDGDMGGGRTARGRKEGPKAAIIKDQLNRLKEMVPGESDVNTIDDSTGETLLEIACRMTEPSSAIISYLLTSGADDHHTDPHGCTALHKLCGASGDPGAIRLLVEAGASIRAQDHQGCTALHFLAKHQPANSEAALQLGLSVDHLMQAGADVNATNLEGQTPVHFAILYGNTEMLDLLLVRGGDINHVDNNGNTALHAAVRGDNVDMVAKLLEMKISPDLNWGCGTAIEVAMQMHNINSTAIFSLLTSGLLVPMGGTRQRSNTVENIVADAFSAYD